MRNFIVTAVVVKYSVMAAAVERFREFVTQSDIREYHIVL